MSPRIRRVLVSDGFAAVALSLPFVAARVVGPSFPDRALEIGVAGWAVFGVLLLFPHVDPKRKTRWSGKPLPQARLGVAVVAAAAALVQARIRLGGNDAFADRLDLLAGVVVLGLLGNAMPALRPNWFFGIRTPWTLRDDRVWARTHRVGGHAIVAATIGLVLVWPWLDASAFQTLFLTTTVGVLIVTAGYSWRLARRLGAAEPL